MSKDLVDRVAKWIAEEVLNRSWEGLHEGSSLAHGFDPWAYCPSGPACNARREDFRTAARTLINMVRAGRGS